MTATQTMPDTAKIVSNTDKHTIFEVSVRGTTHSITWEKTPNGIHKTAGFVTCCCGTHRLINDHVHLGINKPDTHVSLSDSCPNIRTHDYYLQPNGKVYERAPELTGL